MAMVFGRVRGLSCFRANVQRILTHRKILANTLKLDCKHHQLSTFRDFIQKSGISDILN